MSLFFSFDGIDGAGKSTQIDRFCRWLESEGVDFVTCRDPGGTPIGEEVRRLLLNSSDDSPIGSRCEMLLYMAARAQLVESVIKPALATGQVVVSDRFLLANVVYQGHASDLPVEAVRTVGRVAVDGTTPDCTFVLDLDVEQTVARMGPDLDRIERRGLDYRRRLREGFLIESKAMGDRVHVVDAARSIDDIADDVRAIATPLLQDQVKGRAQ